MTTYDVFHKYPNGEIRHMGTVIARNAAEARTDANVQFPVPQIDLREVSGIVSIGQVLTSGFRSVGG